MQLGADFSRKVTRPVTCRLVFASASRALHVVIAFAFGPCAGVLSVSETPATADDKAPPTHHHNKRTVPACTGGGHD